MNCVTSRQLIGEYLDEELKAALRTELQEHLAECPECSEACSRLRDLKAGIRAHSPHYEAPVALLESLRTSVRREAYRENTRPSARAANPAWRWVALAASILLFVSLAWNLALVQSRNSDQDLLAENLLASHIRSLMGTHLLDVPSSDQHTVKPWFAGKLNFSPEVKDLSALGFPLTGGRIDYLPGQTVAVLVYRRRQHVVNLFTWPSTAAVGAKQWARQGFNLVRWGDAGMTYWAVSDIPVAELREFQALYQK